MMIRPFFVGAILVVSSLTHTASAEDIADALNQKILEAPIVETSRDIKVRLETIKRKEDLPLAKLSTTAKEHKALQAEFPSLCSKESCICNENRAYLVFSTQNDSQKSGIEFINKNEVGISHDKSRMCKGSQHSETISLPQYVSVKYPFVSIIRLESYTSYSGEKHSSYLPITYSMSEKKVSTLGDIVEPKQREPLISFLKETSWKSVDGELLKRLTLSFYIAHGKVWIDTLCVDSHCPLTPIEIPQNFIKPNFLKLISEEVRG